MDELNANSQVTHSEDLVADVKGCSNDCSCGSSRDSSNSVSMPICFLVREQAKSLVAIKDLRSRVSNVENVQADVIDSLMQLQSYLCQSSNSDSEVSPSYLNTSKSSDSPSTSKLNATTYHSTLEPLRSILKTRSYSANENICDQFQGASSMVTLQDQPQKHFDSSKSKDSALESDKQDSGLDSDCREHNEGHFSFRNPNFISPESSDQLLQLLDEISFHSEHLQKQLAVVEDTTILSDTKEATSVHDHSKVPNTSSSSGGNSCLEANLDVLEAIDMDSERRRDNLKSISGDNHGTCVQAAVPAATKFNNSGFAGFFEKKSFCNKGPSARKRVGKNIDSNLVSSILKETNLVDLQRQALIYLVDNAVLNTKLREVEQALSCKNVESDKVENVLKDEARLLMMENRELRICLDEQKMETNVLKARVSMLERVLQSITAENKELNLQLGESLNLQQFCKKGSSFAFTSPTSTTRSVRKNPSLSSQAYRYSNLGCAKSKLLSDSSSFLEATVEEPDEDQTTGAAFKCRTGPLQSSTPFQRTKISVTDSPSGASFHSVKKCLKPNLSFDSESVSFRSAKCERYSDDSDNIPNACVKKRPHSQASSHETLTLPMGNVSKFPFSTILEKLKANSEVRLSRSVPKDESASASDHEMDTTSNTSATQGHHRSQSRETKSAQGSNKSSLQTRKSRNIHQRIQNILDRIVAESEEAS